MKASEILLRAADYLDAEHAKRLPSSMIGCCCAIRAVGLYPNAAHAQDYLATAHPIRSWRYGGGYWWGNPAKTPNTAKWVAALRKAAALAQKEGR